MVYRYIPQGGSRTAALLSGEVDLIDYVPVQDVPRLQQDPRFSVFQIDSITFVYLAPDAMRESSPFVTDKQGKPLLANPLADRRVREALSLAIPRQQIAERLYSGLASPADQFAAPAAEHRLEGLSPLPFDAARARALLAEAGFGQGFRLTLHGPNGFFPSDDNLLQAIAQGFSRIGIEAQVQTLPPANLFTRATNRDFSMFMTYYSSYTSLIPLRNVVIARCRVGPRRLQPAALFQPGGGRAARPGAGDDGRGAAARADAASRAGAAGGQGRHPGHQPAQCLGRAARPRGLRPEPAEHDGAAAGAAPGMRAG